MLTGDNGLLTKASTAKTETEFKSEEEQVRLAIAAALTNENVSMDKTVLREELSKIEGLTGVPTDDTYNFPLTVTGKSGNKYRITDTGKLTVKVATNSTGLNPGEMATSTEKDNYDDGSTTATIPEGFTVSKIDEETTVAGGLVIYDIPEGDLTKEDLWTATNEDGTLKVQTDYNQFVWIPVDNSSDGTFNRIFKRTEGYSSGSLQDWLEYCGEADASGENTYLKKVGFEENDTTKAEAIAMYASVKQYGGFYIGRYEAGIEEPEARENGDYFDANTMVIKKNKHVYNYIGWSNSDNMDAIEGGAVQKSREMTFANSSKIKVTPTLCYGVQWDAALNFIDPNFITNQKKEETPNCSSNSYLVDSEDKGWYENNYEEGNPEHKTGIDVIVGGQVTNSPNNIYDMAGNVYEWTMESCYNVFNCDDIRGRVLRGGCYYAYSGSNHPASVRHGTYGPSHTDYDNNGFRVALYL